ncbi:MAG TPA: hypothetical protein VFV93_01560 [Thermomicrobiales bacterium]|nr:hypothetical protein [Thermomicrobiales bacterium]
MRLGNAGQRHAGQARVSSLVRMLVTAVAGLTIFTGCATVRFGSAFTETGKATHTLELTIPRSSMTEQDLARVERQLADAEKNARAGGLTTVRIDNPETIGIRVINTTQDATDAGLALNSILNTLIVDETTGPVAPFQGTFQRVSEPVGGNVFELKMTVDGDILYSAAAKVAPGHPQFSTAEGVREVVTIEYVVTMPGEIVETNGGKQGEGSVVWSIPLQGPTQLEARSTVGKDTPWFWTILAIVASLAVVALTTALIWKLLIARQRAGRPGRRLALDASASPAMSMPPYSLPELRATLAGLVRRALHGERLNPRPPRQARQQPGSEESSRGADAQGD